MGLRSFYTKLRSCTETLLEDPPVNRKARLVEAVIICLILMVCAVPPIQAYTDSSWIKRALGLVETCITCVFLVEYLLRLWIAPKKLKHVLHPYSIIDLLAILPLFLPGTYLQLLRLFRLLRILRLVRYLKDPHFFFGTISRKHLIIIRIVFTVLAIIFVSSGLIYYAEHQANPKGFKTFADAVYFSIVTMATVGYGDITPITMYGRWVTVMIIFGGIVLLPWQIKDLIEQIVLGYTKVRVRCTHCDLEPHEQDARYCRRCGTALSVISEDKGGGSGVQEDHRAVESGPAAPS